MLRRSSFGAFAASGFKLLVVPVVLVVLGLAFSLPAQSMAILFLMAASPTAAASFIMARALGGNSQLAANIVALSTLFSIVTASLGLALLKGYFP